MKRFTVNIFLTLALLMLLLLAAVYDLRAQNIEASYSIQSTVMGPQKGYEIGFRNQKGIGAAICYQSSNNLPLEKGPQAYPFTSVDFSAMIKNCGTMSILGHIKTGLVNNQFLIVTPEIETRIQIWKFLHVAIGAGMRSRQAAVSGKIILSTF